MAGSVLSATILLSCILAAAARYRPVVLMHGLMANAEAMSHAEGWIKETFPGIYVKNVEIGNGKEDSLFMNINKQIEEFAKVVKADKNLTQGFNMIGHSQGGLVTRAYVERFNDPPVHNLISWAGPQDGVYGVPDFNAFCPDSLCPWIDEIADIIASGFVGQIAQRKFSFFAYWKDIIHFDEYKKENIFLKDINNEGTIPNATYKQNLISLNHYALIYSTTDDIVVPRQSPWFEFYAEGQDKELVPFEASETYKKDLIGLHTMSDQGKLSFSTVACSHQDIPRDVCRNQSFAPAIQQLLNNSIDRV